MMSFFQDERSLKQLSNATQQKTKSVKKVITYLEMNLEAIFLEHLELYIGGNFFYQKNFSQFFQL